MLFGFQPPATIMHAKSAIVWLRILSSIPWLVSAFVGPRATVTPGFISGRGLLAQIHATFIHTAIDGRVVQILVWYVAPHAALFALLIAVADVVAGASLALGFCVRFVSLIAIARAATNIMVAAGAGIDTIGYNGMLIVTAAICLATAAGRKAGIDAKLINRFPQIEALRLVA